jgi:biotin carboxyl carrier protein
MASQRRIEVTVNGKSYLIEVGDLYASPIRVTVDGRPYVVSVETVESASPSRVPAALDAVARPTSAPAKTPVPAVTELKAPMPGHIADVAVRPGDRVVFGQTLCALEAMKMKSAIRSPRDGVVAAVRVSDGQAVAFGDILLIFEESTP